MKRYKAGPRAQPFPRQRPPVTVTASKANPFAVNCGESWHLLIVPEIGRDSLSGLGQSRESCRTGTAIRPGKRVADSKPTDDNGEDR